MRALQLTVPAPVETAPLRLTQLPEPIPQADEVLVKVHACGICHTDLHTVEGELRLPKLPVTPGHQIVGYVVSAPADSAFRPGQRVGIPWMNSTCGWCQFCTSGRENLCLNARFTGLHVNGGYAEYALVNHHFAVPLPEGLNDIEAAPLLCAGIIGLRALRLAGIDPPASAPAASRPRLGLFGFGASAHITLQIARYWRSPVFVFSRGEAHRQLALQLGADWAGTSNQQPPELLDAAIIFAPAGELVPIALNYLERGGRVVLAGIYSSPIPALDYSLLYHERTITTVANATAEDAELLLRLSGQIPIRTTTQVFPLEQANHALQLLKNGRINGAGVLQVASRS